MATYRKIGEFDKTSEDWPNYIERVEFYFAANGIVDREGATQRRKAVLLSLVGAEMYRLIKNLVAPDKVATKSEKEYYCRKIRF